MQTVKERSWLARMLATMGAFRLHTIVDGGAARAPATISREGNSCQIVPGGR
jgi:hypothetical protein